MEKDIGEALGDIYWASKIVGIKYHKDSNHIKIEIPYQQERIILQ